MLFPSVGGYMLRNTKDILSLKNVVRFFLWEL